MDSVAVVVVILGSLGMALVGLAYGDYAVWLSRIRPLTWSWRIHSFLVLYAIGVGLTTIPWLVATPYRSWFVLIDQFRAIALTGLLPLFLWYIFAWPLRLARSYSRATRPEPLENHPLDGAWSSRPSFLDRIAQSRAESEPSVDPRLRGDDRPPALDRVGRLRPGEAADLEGS